MRECVSSRQRFRSNCPVNAALHRPCSWLSPPLAFGSSLYLFSPPATQRYSISVFVVNTLARFPCFFTLASTFAFCLWLVHAQGATDSNCLGGHQTRPPPPILSLSICSFVHHCRTSEHFFLYILTCIRPLYRSNFSLVPVVSAYIARTRFPFHLNQERDYSNSTVNDFLTVIHWSPFPLYCVLFILIIRSFGQNIWLIWIETKQIFSISW